MKLESFPMLVAIGDSGLEEKSGGKHYPKKDSLMTLTDGCILQLRTVCCVCSFSSLVIPHAKNTLRTQGCWVPCIREVP